MCICSGYGKEVVKSGRKLDFFISVGTTRDPEIVRVIAGKCYLKETNLFTSLEQRKTLNKD